MKLKYYLVRVNGTLFLANGIDEEKERICNCPFDNRNSEPAKCGSWCPLFRITGQEDKERGMKMKIELACGSGWGEFVEKVM